MHLGVVARIDELLVAFEHQALQLRSGIQGGANRIGAERADGGVHGIDLQNVERGKQAFEQRAERFAQRAARLVRLRRERRDFLSERKPGQRLAQLVNGWRRDRHSSHRLAGRPGAVDFQLPRLMRGVEHPGVVDFREVVILGRQPEDRDRVDAARRQIARELGRRERFVNRIRRTGEQADLLSCNHGHRSRLRQQGERRTVAVPLPQSRNQGGAPFRAEIDLRRGRLVGRRIMRIVRIKRANALGMIDQVQKKLGGMRKLEVRDAATFHAKAQVTRCWTLTGGFGFWSPTWNFRNGRSGTCPTISPPAGSWRCRCIARTPPRPSGRRIPP